MGTSNILSQMLTYKGSISACWTAIGQAEKTVSLPTGRNILFNVVKLEQLNFSNASNNTCTNLGGLFVVCPQLTPMCVDIINGIERSVIGGAQYQNGGVSPAVGGNYYVSDSLSPYKATSTAADNLRGDLTFQIFRAETGQLYNAPGNTRFQITVSFWLCEAPSLISNKG